MGWGTFLVRDSDHSTREHLIQLINNEDNFPQREAMKEFLGDSDSPKFSHGIPGDFTPTVDALLNDSRRKLRDEPKSQSTEMVSRTVNSLVRSDPKRFALALTYCAVAPVESWEFGDEEVQLVLETLIAGVGRGGIVALDTDCFFCSGWFIELANPNQGKNAVDKAVEYMHRMLVGDPMLSQMMHGSTPPKTVYLLVFSGDLSPRIPLIVRGPSCPEQLRYTFIDCEALVREDTEGPGDEVRREVGLCFKYLPVRPKTELHKQPGPGASHSGKFLSQDPVAYIALEKLTQLLSVTGLNNLVVWAYGQFEADYTIAPLVRDAKATLFHDQDPRRPLPLRICSGDSDCAILLEGRSGASLGPDVTIHLSLPGEHSRVAMHSHQFPLLLDWMECLTFRKVLREARSELAVPHLPRGARLPHPGGDAHPRTLLAYHLRVAMLAHTDRFLQGEEYDTACSESIANLQSCLWRRGKIKLPDVWNPEIFPAKPLSSNEIPQDVRKLKEAKAMREKEATAARTSLLLLCQFLGERVRGESWDCTRYLFCVSRLDTDLYYQLAALSSAKHIKDRWEDGTEYYARHVCLNHNSTRDFSGPLVEGVRLLAGGRPTTKEDYESGVMFFDSSEPAAPLRGLPRFGGGYYSGIATFLAHVEGRGRCTRDTIAVCRKSENFELEDHQRRERLAPEVAEEVDEIFGKFQGDVPELGQRLVDSVSKLLKADHGEAARLVVRGEGLSDLSEEGVYAFQRAGRFIKELWSLVQHGSQLPITDQTRLELIRFLNRHPYYYEKPPTPDPEPGVEGGEEEDTSASATDSETEWEPDEGSVGYASPLRGLPPDCPQTGEGVSPRQSHFAPTP